MRGTNAVRVLVAAGALVAAASIADPAAVKGKFLGNGKDGQLAHAVAVPHEKWQDEEAWTVVLTELPAPPDSKPDWDGPFGKLGAALSVSVTAKGELFGTEIYHPALEHKPFSSIGPLQLEGFQIDGESISGRLFTREPDEFFGDVWEVDLTFRATKRAGK